MEKVFAYLRVSSAGQAKDRRDGFPRQEAAIKEYARANKLHIEQWFKEDITGTEAKRPVLAEMMVKLEQNGHGITTVIIEKLDRLARDLMIQEAIIRDLQRGGFALISAAEGPDLCSDDPTRKLLRHLFGAIAEYEKTMLVAKLRAARERKRAKGEKADGQIGYRDSAEGQAIVRRITGLMRKRKFGGKRTLQEIADYLNAIGVKTLKGHQWTTAHVQKAIISPKPRKTTKS